MAVQYIEVFDKWQVFEGIDSSNEDAVVIKVLKPVAKRKIKREIKVLRNLSGGPNIVGLVDVVRDTTSRSHSLVMEHVNSSDWGDIYHSFTELEIKQYIFQVLRVRSPLRASEWRLHPQLRPSSSLTHAGSCIEMSNLVTSFLIVNDAR